MTGYLAVVAVVATALAPLGIQPTAWAGPGSVISGSVWADTDKDDLRDGAEPAQPGVTVVLVDDAGTPVPGFSATTDATGGYRFTNVPDGTYRVRIDAPGTFTFGTAGGDNDFSSTGTPAPNAPQRGATALLTVAGASQHTGLDAGMEPLAILRVSALPDQIPEDGTGCQGFQIVTGGVSAPLDTEGTDGQGGVDRSDDNCIIRTGDTVREQFGVDVTNLQSENIENVILEFAIRPQDGAQLELVGPAAGGLPSGCLARGQLGADPGSSASTDPATGVITVLCNVGPADNDLTTIEVSYRHKSDTAIPSSAVIDARAWAADGDATDSNVATGPEVFVTGRADWALAKVQNNAAGATSPNFADVPGLGRVPGMQMNYVITIQQPEGTTGNGALDGWFDFVDTMGAQYPNAIITSCARLGNGLWQPTCETSSVAGADGWDIAIDPVNDAALDRTGDRISVWVFVPEQDIFRALDPSWQPGDERPTGTLDFDNAITETDGWAMRGGEPNNGDAGDDGATHPGGGPVLPGFEAGWDGENASGDNLVESQLSFRAPVWDLAKSLAAGPTYVEDKDANGDVTRSGFEVWFNLNLTETNGALLAPFVDDVTFNDYLRSHPDAVLMACRTTPVTGQPSTGTTSCAEAVGTTPGADGWEIHFDPSEYGESMRRGLMQVQVFIPAPEPDYDPCVEPSDERIVIDNDAQDTDGWTAGGVPINPDSSEPGTEPGWGAAQVGADVAAGNNTVRVERLVNQTVTAAFCGTLTGNKVWQNGPTLTWPGRDITSWAALTASSERVEVTDPMVCDVYDVSVLALRDQAFGAGRFVQVTFNGGIAPGDATLDPDDYVLEFAAGPNDTQTQATPPVVSSLERAATDCATHDGPWFTDPRDYGADWRDHVNMVRVRPVQWGQVEQGPFRIEFFAPLTTRGVYNGGPDAGEVIPDGVRVTNVGSWSDRDPETDTLAHVTRTVPFQGARLQVGKAVTPTQYLPGDRVVWDLSMQVTQGVPGTTLTDLRLVDTLPAGLSLDVECTQARLPEGVDLDVNLATGQATFSLGDVTTTTNPHWVVHPTVAGAVRIQLCATIGTTAAPGDRFTNRVQGFATETPDSNVAQSTIEIVGPGQLGIEKRVDKPYVASGEEYTWTLTWADTSPVSSFANPDVIDVLPWDGDGEEGVGSHRDGFGSQFTGVARLTGPLAQPTYTRGGTGVGNAVRGTWYYTTAPPETLDHDSRVAANRNPQAAGGLWLTEAEVPDFDDVTGIRFVHATSITPLTRVEARVPMVSTTDDLDVWYVNRGSITTITSPDSLLLSNQPVVQIPGFALGDLVWIDRSPDGRFTDGVDEPVAGVLVEVLDQDGRVVGTATTDGSGRWSVSAIPAGTYRARIPASQFQAGGPLATFQVQTVGSSEAEDENEGVSNSNTPTSDPRVSGLVSSPVTLAYVYDGEDRLVGANGPTDDDVANLAPPRVAAEFTNFTVDLALRAAPGVDIEKHTNTVDADEPPGPSVAVGGPVEWTYVVTNTGSTDLFEITVTDDVVDDAQIDCGDGTNVVAGPLAIGATVTCVATGVATAGQYANLGSVVARGPLALDENGEPLPPDEQDPPVTDEDWSHYFGAAPEVDIEKHTDGVDADEPTGPFVPVGDTVTWTYVVTNTGNVPLTDVTVTDDRVAASSIDCAGGSNVVAGPLEPGGSFTCEAQGVAAPGQYANLGSVAGTPPSTTSPDGETVPPEAPVTDEDWSHYFGAEIGLDLTKDAVDAESVSSAGDVVTYEFVLTNTGNTTVTDARIDDPMPGLSEIVYDWPGEPGVLEAGQSVRARATYTVTEADVEAGEVLNAAIAVGNPEPGASPEPVPPVVSPEVEEEFEVPQPSGGLAVTGGTAAGVIVVATALLLAGGVLLVARRRNAVEHR